MANHRKLAQNILVSRFCGTNTNTQMLTGLRYYPHFIKPLHSGSRTDSEKTTYLATTEYFLV
jgi:hypothetical protein